MADITPADAVEIQKELYAAGIFHTAAYKKNPALGLAKKVKFTGKHYEFPVEYGDAPNRSRTASVALGKANTTNFVEFNVPTVESFEAKNISQKAIVETRDEGAFVDLLKNTMETVARSLGNGLGGDAFLHRGASLAQVGSIPTATTLVIKNPSHVTRFSVGQEIRSAETDGLSGGLQAGSATITAIDRDTGTLTTDGAGWVDQIATLDADDFLFPDGDFALGRAGLADWVPDSTAGLGSAFYGAIRDVDATRLAGCRQTVAIGTDIASSLNALMSRMGREEAEMNACLLSYDMLSELQTQTDSKVMIAGTVKAKNVNLGYEALTMTVAGHKVNFVPDRSCGDDRIYVGNDEGLEVIHSQAEPVKLDDMDGNVLSRNATAFSYDVRGSSYSNYIVRRARDWGVLIFS